jgi:hypothetical protein
MYRRQRMPNQLQGKLSLMKNRNTITIICTTILLALGCFGLLPKAAAVVPPPDGGYPGGNTAEGQNALFSLTTGGFNTAIGWLSLRSNTEGNFNTAIGAGALFANITAALNTATGAGALSSNVSGINNTANGAFALFNTTGDGNTGVGRDALFSNTTANFNTAVGSFALADNTTGAANTANGEGALRSNISGNSNTATGSGALSSNTGGFNNTAIGEAALSSNTTGSFNIALGVIAGSNLTTGNGNIDIGNTGVADESDTIRIGENQTRTFITGISGVEVTGAGVVVASNGQLGVAPSSQRFKDEINSMDQASEALYGLRPVIFRYKKEIDPQGSPQWGLVAEEVEKVNPNLVVRDKQGRPYSVRYDQVNAMLLNEFLKEHQTVRELKATVAQQTKGMEELTMLLKEQAAQIQKVSAQIEMSKPAPKVVLNDP